MGYKLDAIISRHSFGDVEKNDPSAEKTLITIIPHEGRRNSAPCVLFFLEDETITINSGAGAAIINKAYLEFYRDALDFILSMEDDKDNSNER